MSHRSAPFLLLIVCRGLLHAEVQLPALFSEHAVLMKSASVPIWGKAKPGEEVTVAIAGKTAHAQTGPNGKWMARMDLANAEAGPFEMVVSGENKIVVPDVVIGRVWLAAGQSNMERMLKQTADADTEIAKSANPLLRQFRVEKTTRPVPSDDCKGKWTLAAPETSGDFTAVGYYFGKQLQSELKEPIGIINASWGGTFSEAWTSLDALNSVESLRNGEAERRQTVAEYPEKKRAFVADFAKWLQEKGREDHPAMDPSSFAGDMITATDWTPLQLPGKIAGDQLPSSGAVWIRKEVELPATVVTPAFEFKIQLGPVGGFDQVFWNGKKVSETPYTKLPGANYSRYFPVPFDQLKVGKNILAVRIYAPALPPSVPANPLEFRAGPVSLTGEWLAKADYRLPDLPAEVVATAPKPPLQPPGMMGGAIFNGMIHPLAPYALDGILWYQGESNTGRSVQQQIAFPLLIENWRRKWNQELPFYFCQLAGYLPKLPTPSESAWAELREAQSKTLRLPKTGQAVLIDLGESADIHPRNKKDVGLRLARLALANQYGKDVVSSGPVFDSMKIEDSSARLTFSHAEGGLVAQPLPATYPLSTLLGRAAPLVRNSPNSPLEGFAICGTDHRWVWADARIEGNTVVVWSEKVSAPVAVRYAWADDPTCNLYNGAGLPASPFRTDDFRATTQEKTYGAGS